MEELGLTRSRVMTFLMFDLPAVCPRMSAFFHFF